MKSITTNDHTSHFFEVPVFFNRYKPKHRSRLDIDTLQSFQYIEAVLLTNQQRTLIYCIIRNYNTIATNVRLTIPIDIF